MLTESTPDKSVCWEWQGACDKDGYGVFDINGRTRSAHKVSYELKVGPVKPGQVLLHSCDNPPCCNYHHLTPGTQQENMQDMVEKGRHGNRYVAPVRDAELEPKAVCMYCGDQVKNLAHHQARCPWYKEAKMLEEYGAGED